NGCTSNKSWNFLWRMAYSKDNGSKDYPAQTIPRVCCRDKCSQYTCHSCMAWNSCKYYTCNFWKYNGSGSSKKNVCSKMGNRKKNRVGMDNHHTCQCSSVICHNAIHKSNISLRNFITYYYKLL